MACHTQDEIAEVCDSSRDDVRGVLGKMEKLPKSPKATFIEDDFDPPIYNVWKYKKKVQPLRAISYMGCQRFLLSLYPFLINAKLHRLKSSGISGKISLIALITTGCSFPNTLATSREVVQKLDSLSAICNKIT